MALALPMTDVRQRVLADVVAQVARRARSPRATYRLQFHEQFGFAEAERIVVYLARLGITHLYASPLLRARPHSEHGYNVCSHTDVNPELGGEAALARLAETLAARHMGWLLDVVPNHMAASTDNPWWNDVLENGPSSPYAHYFDINWHPVKDELAGKVLLPILGEQYGEALEKGQLILAHADGGFVLRYFETRLPIGPKTALPVMTDRLDSLREQLADQTDAWQEYQSILTALEHLPSQDATTIEAVIERHREKEIIKRRVRSLEEACPAVRQFLAENTARFNGTPGSAESFDRLDALLATQAYRLSHWRAAADEINYRRFFDINELAALCMESADVFREAHQRVIDFVTRDNTSGLRIDHIDGLLAPATYLWRLQWAFLTQLAEHSWLRHAAEADAAAEGAFDAHQARRAWREMGPALLAAIARALGLKPPDPASEPALFAGEPAEHEPPELASSPSPLPEASHATPGIEPPLYVVAEKILGPQEPLPDDWPLAGTTGYDFVQFVNGLSIDAAGWDALVKQYVRVTDSPARFDEVVRLCKLLILRVAMASELQLLAHQLNRISEQHRSTRDFTLNMLRYALREILIYFPVYRVYPSRAGVSERDRRFVNLATSLAKRRNPATDPAIFDFVRSVLLLEHPSGISDDEIRERELFAGRFQQVTSPVMAKGVEDTAFYVYFPLASANEVGCDPRSPCVSVAMFHQENLARRNRHPASMLATSTHDTKRSEDLRARLNLLSEMPGEWKSALTRWMRINKRYRQPTDVGPAPSRNDEYLFYQSLLGVWPLAPLDDAGRQALAERLQAYMEKATREAKQNTSWVHPNEEYDRGVREFIGQVLSPRQNERFLSDFAQFAERTLDFGLFNSLGQVVLKLTSPGVPDFYQGQELWDFSLVDPDNRRPVDFSRRQQLLEDLASLDERALSALARQLAARPRDDRLKLLVTWRLLQLRQQNNELFTQGGYVPLDVHGPAAEHLVAFARLPAELPANASPRGSILVLVPRLAYRLAASATPAAGTLPRPWQPELWQGTELWAPRWRGRRLRNLFTGEEHLIAGEQVPVAALWGGFPVAVYQQVDAE